jgi:hypothetical protein
MASLRVFQQAKEVGVDGKEVRFMWTRGSHKHVVRTVAPFIGEPIKVLPGQLHRGRAVDITWPSGLTSVFFIVDVYGNEHNSGDPLFMFSRVQEDSEFTFCVVMPGFHYSFQAVARGKTYCHWIPDDNGQQALVSKQHCFRASRRGNFELAEPTALKDLKSHARSSGDDGDDLDIAARIAAATAAGLRFQQQNQQASSSSSSSSSTMQVPAPSSSGEEVGRPQILELAQLVVSAVSDGLEDVQFQ